MKIIAVIAVAAITIVIIAAVFILPEDEAIIAQDEAEITFTTGGNVSFQILCEIADTDDERAIGLMDREEMADDRGMLFVFANNSTSGFWMKNTLIPLDIIFIAENGTVINIEEAIVEEPDTPESDFAHYFSDAPYKWVVEINLGLSQQYGIGPGTQVDIEMIGVD